MSAASEEAVVVIGGAAGIGGAVLADLARAFPGCVPWITYHADEGAARECADTIPGARICQCNLEDPGSLGRLADSITDAGARTVRALVHSAVVARRGSLQALGPGQITEVVRSSGISLLTAVTAFDRMLTAGSTVLYLTSMGARRAIPDYGAVGIAKAAGEALVRYLAVELAPRRIRVNAISAGAVRTKAFDAMFTAPDERLEQMAKGSPRGYGLSLEEIAFVARSLCEPGASGVSGQVITVDGAYYAMR